MQHFQASKGSSSVAFLGMVVFLITLSVALVSGVGYAPSDYTSNGGGAQSQTGDSQIIITAPPPNAEDNLQLRTFGIISTTPKLIPTEYNIQTPAVCTPTRTTETLLVIDNSGSMDGNNLVQSKVAGRHLVDILSGNPANKIGLVIFSKTAEVYINPTNDFPAVKASIDRIPESGNTCIQCGVKTANDVIATRGQVGLPKSIILLTDGRANHIDGKSANSSLAAQAAKDEVIRGFTTSQTVFYPIGFGKSVNTQFMTEAASLTGGVYYFAPSAQDLATIFNEIAKSICQ